MIISLKLPIAEMKESGIIMKREIIIEVMYNVGLFVAAFIALLLTMIIIGGTLLGLILLPTTIQITLFSIFFIFATASIVVFLKRDFL